MPDEAPRSDGGEAPRVGKASQRLGLVLADRYRLDRLLGQGATGAVYLAEHVHMRKRFALKLLHHSAKASPELVARFEREAITAGHLDHPNVATASDFGRLDDGSFFLVLEYVDGRSLRDTIDHEGALHPRVALGVARQILAALAAAHALGIVHRDVKPDNVMLVARSRSSPSAAPFPGATDDDPLVKVLDFGIAKVDASGSLGVEATAGGTPLTRVGAVYGTPAYMAPEQAAGGEVDARADLYAIGSVLFEMIAGRPPFTGEAMEIFAQMLVDAPPRLASPIAPELVSDELRALVDALLAKAREARPSSAAEVIARVDALLGMLSSADAPPASAGGGATPIGWTPNATSMAGPIVVVPPSPGSPWLRRLDAALARLDPLARRLRLSPRRAAVVVACAILAPIVLLVALATRRSNVDDDADARSARRERRHISSAPAVAEPPSASAPPTASAPPPTRSRRHRRHAPAAPAATASASASASSSASADPLQQWIGFP